LSAVIISVPTYGSLFVCFQSPRYSAGKGKAYEIDS
jgi:hypothetical protein